MATDIKTHANENEINISSTNKNFKRKIRITEVQQIHIITFWITLILFLIFSLFVFFNMEK